MGRSLLFGAVMCAILLVAATTRSDVASSDVNVDTTEPLPEHITGTAVEPAPNADPPPKDPFAPFDVGPPESVWPYESLTAAEKAVVDRGRNATSWRETHNAYAAGVTLRATRGRAEAAQHMLGVDSGIERTGVVP